MGKWEKYGVITGGIFGAAAGGVGGVVSAGLTIWSCGFVKDAPPKELAPQEQCDAWLEQFEGIPLSWNNTSARDQYNAHCEQHPNTYRETCYGVVSSLGALPEILLAVGLGLSVGAFTGRFLGLLLDNCLSSKVNEQDEEHLQTDSDTETQTDEEIFTP